MTQCMKVKVYSIKKLMFSAGEIALHSTTHSQLFICYRAIKTWNSLPEAHIIGVIRLPNNI